VGGSDASPGRRFRLAVRERPGVRHPGVVLQRHFGESGEAEAVEAMMIIVWWMLLGGSLAKEPFVWAG
jgi:hypothetical protein